MTARLLVVWGTPRDPAEFERHYREVHMPIAQTMPGLRRYTVGRGTGDDAHYLVAELDFDDEAAMHAAIESPQGRAASADGAVLRALSSPYSVTYELEEVV